MTLKKFLIILCCVLAAALLIAVLGRTDQGKNTVTFYYVRSQYAYGTEDGVIGSEQRDITGHENDLDYLLALYLEGPLDSGLRSPFPGKSATRILSQQRRGDALQIQLTDMTKVMSDSEFTLACACLTRTCLGMTKVLAVQITSGPRSIRMNPTNLVLFDESTAVKKPKTEE